jgi:hypothetical protein
VVKQISEKYWRIAAKNPELFWMPGEAEKIKILTRNAGDHRQASSLCRRR